MSTEAPASSSRDPRERKLAKRKRKGVSRDDAHDLHRTHRYRWYRKIQHLALDRLMQAGSFHASDLDDTDLPDGMSRSIIGSAINGLVMAKLIRPLGGPKHCKSGLRHYNFLHTWQLAVDHVAVRAWKKSHSIPPEEGDSDA